MRRSRAGAGEGAGAGAGVGGFIPEQFLILFGYILQAWTSLIQQTLSIIVLFISVPMVQCNSSH